MLFSVGPALALGHTNVQEVLKEGARSASASRRTLVFGRAMIALQLALTIVLMAGAGLMVKSVWRLTSHPAGFRPEQILTLRMDFRGPAYRDDRARHVLAEALLERARALPGVRDAAITTDRGSMTIVIKEGEPMPKDRERHGAPISAVSPGFGPLLGMSLVRGRWLEEVEPQGAVLINEGLARREFPGVDPIGRRLRMPWLGAENFSPIVGVVADLKYAELDTEAPPEIFVHHAQARLFGITLALLVDGDPLAAAPEIRKALGAVDPTQSIFGVRTLEQALAETIAPRRFNLLLLGTFAAVALLLAALGVYGVVAYAVAERTHEIGIRLALGAERLSVVRMIVAQGMVSVTAGIAGGLLAAMAATRLIAGLLYGVDAHDAPTFIIATLLLGAIALLACAAPALRAAMVNPAIALRAE
jgi:putative ABC transport system permease protein